MMETAGAVLQKTGLIMLAGALGSLCRYGLSSGVYWLVGRAFPWGTAFVNLLGCFLFGLVWVLAEERNLIPEAFRVVLLVGFMGAFTTFSTFIFECAGLVHHGEWLKFVLNMAGQNFLGLMALYLGYAFGRLFG